MTRDSFHLLILLLICQEKVYGDICDRSCTCEPRDDPLDVRCPNASIHIIPQDLPPFMEFLDLTGNDLSVIEPTLNHYERLLSLDLRDNRINTLRPKSFLNLRELNHLDLSGNRLSRIGKSDLKGLKTLKTLSLRGNQIIELQEFWLHCPSLESLDLSKNQIYTFSRDVFKNLKHLKSLDFSHNRLTSLSFLRDFRLPLLTDLTLDGNDFASIREKSPFQHLSSLNRLSMSGCHLSEQSPTFFQGLRGLKELDLRDNLIETLPSPGIDIVDLRGLTTLRIGSIILREINSGVGRLISLTELSISGCINSLPFTLKEDSFRNCTLLKGINITSCHGLEYIPDGIFLELPHLEYLNLRGNALKSISPRIADWNALKYVDLDSNPLECGCEMSWILESSFDHFRSLLRGRATCESGQPIHRMDISACQEGFFQTHLLAIVLGAIGGGLGLMALVILFLYFLRQRRSKGTRFHRKKFGKISKHEISVIPRNVSNPAGYKDIITEESLPLGGNLLNFPDVKTSVL